MHIPHIPEISDEELRRRAERIKPVGRFDADGKMIWDRRYPQRYLVHRDDILLPEVQEGNLYNYLPGPEVPKEENLLLLHSMNVYIPYGIFVIVWPTLQRVLSQIWESEAERAVAFELPDPKMGSLVWQELEEHKCFLGLIQVYESHKTTTETERR